MSSNNQHNLQCGFAEDLVSYLYGEINSYEKARFERHLSACPQCEHELNDFAAVRSSVGVWRDKMFSPLETPKTIVPYAKKPEMPETSPLPDMTRSRASGFFALFTLNPARAAAAFAVLAVFASLTFFIFNFSNSGENLSGGKLAENSGETNATVAELPNEIKSADIIKPDAKDQPVADISAKHLPEDGSSSPPEKTKSASRRKSAAKNSGISPQIKRSIKKPAAAALAQKETDRSKTVSPRVKDAPKLSDLADEADDESLRLSDLFDEVGSR